LDLCHALVKGKAPGDEPLPERQGQTQQGEGAENQVQDHCLFLMVVVSAILIEPAAERKRKSESRGHKEMNGNCTAGRIQATVAADGSRRTFPYSAESAPAAVGDYDLVGCEG
jgi:hypothetical protein